MLALVAVTFVPDFLLKVIVLLEGWGSGSGGWTKEV